MKYELHGIILIWATTVLLTGCGTAVAPSEPLKNSAGTQTVLPVTNSTPQSDRLDKTAVFAILAQDAAYFNAENFSRWDRLQKTKGEVHIFAHPANSLGFDKLAGVKHFVPTDRLSQEIVKVLATIKADRLIIFVDTHGAPSGNWCYENQRRCALTEKVLIDALQAHSKLTRQGLKQVLIIPLSCFNKPIMDRFDAEAKNLMWAFDLSFIAQKTDEACGTQSPAESLMENLLISLKEISKAQMEELLSVSKLREFIALNNKLVPDEFRFLHYDLRYVKHTGPDLRLADFGFDIWLNAELYNSQLLMPFPFNKTVEQVIHGLLAPQFYINVEELIFQRAEDDIHIKIHGDVSMVLNNSALKDKEYNTLRVVLRRRSGVAPSIPYNLIY